MHMHKHRRTRILFVTIRLQTVWVFKLEYFGLTSIRV